MARGYESKFGPPQGPDSKAKKEMRCYTRCYEINLNYREIRILYDALKKQLKEDMESKTVSSIKRARAIDRLFRVLAPTIKLATSHYLITGDEALTKHDEDHYEEGRDL